MDAVLLWALPDDWVQFELLAPDVAETFDADMRRRFAGSGVDDDALTSLIAAQLQGLQEAAQDGIVLVAACPRKEAGPGDPPPGLSLTLAIGNRPPPGAEAASAGARSPEAVAFVSSALPLRLSEPDMTGFIRETRREIALPGIDPPLARFQAQAFVFPAGEPGFMTVTVTTFDPSLEDDARAAARAFADTLTFVRADEPEEDPR
ncbi:MAG TPA: hypothetical protein VKX24_03375 [Acidimicrobiia bacterium]|nr:hypothetical protein [Acidimicrobiia bacterium]